MLRLRFVFGFLLLFGLILAIVPSGSASAQLADPIPQPIPATGEIVSLETVATGLTAPNWGTSAPGLPGRLFVTDQDGILWSIELATGAKSVFLDVSGQITSLGIFGPGTFDERGLLGVAFHPSYASNGLLYTYTSEPVTGTADFSTMPPAT
ncbi:MAG: PQQ-dependent sugar dehydrogenase, partial [Chloroflexi bacterium]|nr:PQQ-dependent sugar dehydrogenase [Chloroflexota bacterium]